MPEAVSPLNHPVGRRGDDAASRTLIAIPVYNELAHATKLLPTLRELPCDVLFVDDCSTDGTGDLLHAASERGEAFYLRHEQNRGYGRSLIDAFDWADARGYDWVITMDCDEQHDPASIPGFLDEIEADDCDLISGTRYLVLPGEADGDLPPPERRAVNLTITATINELFGWSLTDTFCGYKAHRVRPTCDLDLDESGYAFPLQLWPRVYANGLRVKELPVRRIYNDANRTFGSDPRVGDLDNARNRLGHYLKVLHDELCHLGLPPLRDAVPGVARGVIDALPDTVNGELRDTLRTGLTDAAAAPC